MAIGEFPADPSGFSYTNCAQEQCYWSREAFALAHSCAAAQAYSVARCMPGWLVCKLLTGQSCQFCCRVLGLFPNLKIATSLRAVYMQRRARSSALQERSIDSAQIEVAADSLPPVRQQRLCRFLRVEDCRKRMKKLGGKAKGALVLQQPDPPPPPPTKKQG